MPQHSLAARGEIPMRSASMGTSNARGKKDKGQIKVTVTGKWKVTRSCLHAQLAMSFQGR